MSSFIRLRARTKALPNTGAVILALSAAVAGQSSASAEEAPRCIVQRSGDAPSNIADFKVASDYLSVSELTSVDVRASGWAQGDTIQSSFGIVILKDNLIQSRSEEKSGIGAMSAGAQSQFILEPGHNYKISVKPYGKKTEFRVVQLKISIGGACSAQ
jgi:hypothetical protein